LAARRLIAVMLVLLFLSSLAAAFAPVDRNSETTSSTTTEPLPDLAKDEGKLLRETIDSKAKRPPTIAARVGDQLQLRVEVGRPATLELVGIGDIEDADPVAPALFDVLLDTEGRFPIRALGSKQRVATIQVSPPRAPTGPAPAAAQSRS
jgi:hypothetical protein